MLTLTDSNMQDVSRLIVLLNKIIECVVKIEGRTASFAGITKSIRILNERQLNGFSNLHWYITSDFRMMVERGIYGEVELDQLTDEAYKIIEMNKIFHK
ncbi:hypothetical protein [Dickeya zeae]|uniref:hypothetical protein n=1 Tax=Dickeya zeae TaxID=204042 RepID=UPI000576FB62|nr:hypothetical protein [Dickeya zeae]